MSKKTTHPFCRWFNQIWRVNGKQAHAGGLDRCGGECLACSPRPVVNDEENICRIESRINEDLKPLVTWSPQLLCQSKELRFVERKGIYRFARGNSWWRRALCNRQVGGAAPKWLHLFKFLFELVKSRYKTHQRLCVCFFFYPCRVAGVYAVEAASESTGESTGNDYATDWSTERHAGKILSGLSWRKR